MVRGAIWAIKEARWVRPRIPLWQVMNGRIFIKQIAEVENEREETNDDVILRCAHLGIGSRFSELGGRILFGYSAFNCSVLP